MRHVGLPGVAAKCKRSLEACVARPKTAYFFIEGYTAGASDTVDLEDTAGTGVPQLPTFLWQVCQDIRSPTLVLDNDHGTSPL